MRFMHGNILILSITNLLGNFSRALVFPYASLYILALDGDATKVGLINALAPLIGLFLFPVAGYIADYAGRVKIIALSNYLSAAVILLFVLAPSWQWIAVAMLLRGVVTLQFPARSAMIADSLSPEERGKGLGAMNTIASVLSIFAPWIAGTIVQIYGPNWGIRGLYFAMMVLYLVSAIINHLFLTETAPDSQTSKASNHLSQTTTNQTATKQLVFADLVGAFWDAYRGIFGLLRQLPRSITALTWVLILSFMTNGVISAFWVVYAIEEIGLQPAAWGFILLVEALLRNLLFIPGGLIVDRLGRTSSLLAALVLALLVMPLFILVHSYIAVLMIRIAIAVVHVLIIPASTALIADSVPRSMRGRVMAAIGQGGIMIGAAGGGTGGPAMGYLITLPLMAASFLGGYLYTANPIYPWLFAFVAMILCVALTILFIRDPQSAEV